MKWVAIAGTWKNTNEQVEYDVRREVRKIIKRGDGIVSGGALGVDYFATDETLSFFLPKLIKIIIPSSLDAYINHYRKRVSEGVVESVVVENLIAQLTKIQTLGGLIEGKDTPLNKKAYFDRITRIIEESDELVAFQVNNSEGTQDTINKAKKKGIPVKKYSYEISVC